MIRIGPGGLPGFKTEEGLAEISRLGLSACEIEFTYGVRMSNEAALLAGKAAKENKIMLSVHAPYYVNLASDEKLKVLASVERILQSAQRAHFLGAKYVVFHPGFYQNKTAEETFDLIKEQINNIQAEIKIREWDVFLAPETTGKPSQFGSLAELLRLRKETGCHLTIDFAHLRARGQGEIDYDSVFEKIKGIGHIHSHFSGIEWTEKGEKRHLGLTDDVIKPFISAVIKHNPDITIINESPEPIGDAVKISGILNKMRNLQIK